MRKSIVGVSYGLGQGNAGFGVSASASKAKGNSDSQGISQANSHVNGRESVTFVSGNDTNVLGGMVAGGKVTGSAGGNLNIASRQETEEMRARQQSMGGGISISQAGATGSLSASLGKANGSYANVSEQSGIQAGKDGFDITVKGNTDLHGAVIASEAGKDKNSLTTGTLTWSDIANHSDYSATSAGLTAGGALGAPSGQSNSGQTSGKNTGGINPMIPQHESGSQDGAARSAVAGGTITIKDQANQKQDLADLRRDTAGTNSTVGKNPNLDQVLNKQSDMMAAAQAAGEAVAKTVGDVAGAKEKEARANAKAAHDAGDSEMEHKYLADAKNWEEGGDYRAALHAAGGALVAGLGGGNAVAGAVGAGASSLAAPKLQELGNAVSESLDTGNAGLNEALGNVAANIAAGGFGTIVGGGSGAAAAANVDRFNRQLHPDEQKWIKDNAKAFARRLNGGQAPSDVQVADAEQRLAQQGFRQVQNGAGDAWDQAASGFLSQAHMMLPADPSCAACGISYSFQPTAAQKANADMYANYLPQDRNSSFYAQNDLSQPTSAAVSAANQRAQTINNLMGASTIAAPVAAALLVGAPIATAAGGIFGYAAIGGTVGGGMDASGQYAQTGTIRLFQSLFAGGTGAITGPIGGNVGFIGNVLVGGAGAAANTAFNNIFYGENNSILFAGAVGSTFSGAAYPIGLGVTKLAGQTLPSLVYPNGLKPNIPALLQGSPNPYPANTGATAGSFTQGFGSFFPSKKTGKQ